MEERVSLDSKGNGNTVLYVQLTIILRFTGKNGQGWSQKTESQPFLSVKFKKLAKKSYISQ